jgi:nitrogen regulatory protein PII
MSSEPGQAFELLVIVVKDHRQVEEILTGFLELGIRGATVADVRGMGQIISSEIPIFAGFRSLFPGWGADTYMILSVIEAGTRQRAIEAVREVCGDFDTPGSGILFTVPISYAKGLAEEIG